MRDPIALLRYEASRKPEVAVWVSRAADLSDADIDRAPLLKWMRLALRSLRDSERSRNSYAAVLPHIVAGQVGDPPGVIHRWTGTERFLPFGRRTELLIPYGALLWVPIDGTGLWYETAFSTRLDLLRSSPTSPLRAASKSEYVAAYRGESAARHGGALEPQGLVDHGIPGLRITSLS